MTQPSVSGAPFQIAQAPVSVPPQAPRKVVVTRPADGQSVVVDVRGGAEIDLRGIAAERVVFVQVGDRLVILFENREAVVLQGFYRDGVVAQDLIFQVADGQQVGPQQFASLFPISSDLTILPASGPGSASGGANTAKNVTDPSFGPSGGQRNGLDLLGDTDSGEGLPPPGGPLDGRPSVAALQISVLIDEDGESFKGGIEGGNEGGNDDLEGAPTFFTGRLIYDFGTDGPSATVPISFNVAGLPAATSLGVPVVYQWSQSTRTLTASADGKPVFTLKIDNIFTGEFTFTLFQPLDHPDGQNPGFEDEIVFRFPFTIADSDGDTASGSFTVTVDDDTTVIGRGEDSGEGATGGQPGTVEDEAVNDGNDEEENPDLSATAEGSLNIRWGADNGDNPEEADEGNEEFQAGDRNVAFTDSSVAVSGGFFSGSEPAKDGDTLTGSEEPVMGLNRLTSLGRDVLTTLVGGVLVGYVGAEPPTALDAKGIVFTVLLSDNGSGSYLFTLVQPLDHAAGDGENDLTLTFGYTATDSDGDKVSSTFTVTVQDDVPMIAGGEGSGDPSFVEDEAVNGGNQEEDKDPEGNDLSGTSTGSLVIQWGADSGDDSTETDEGNETFQVGDRNVAFTNANLELSGGFGEGLTSLGSAVSTVLIAGVLVGYVGTQPTSFDPEAPAAGTVFFVQLSDNNSGSYTFNLVQPLDHAAGEGENDLTLTFGYTATDSDGDKASSTFTVTVKDDVVTIGKPEGGDVDEDGLIPLRGNPFGPGDTTQLDGSTTTKSLAISWGADNANDGDGQPGDRSVAFAEGLTVPAGLTSDTLAVTYSFNEDRTVLTASTTAGTVFTVTLSDVDGTYQFDLVGTLDHSVSGTEDNIDLTFGFVATDSDGDTAASSFTVSVDDDTPLVILPLNSSVDEDGPLPIVTGLPGSNPLGNGDNLLALTTATNILGISWGADNNNPTTGTGYSLGDRAVTFGESTTSDLAARGLTSDGHPIQYAVSEGGTLLTAFTDVGGRVTVFTVSLSDQGPLGVGSYTFTLLNNLDHPGPNTEDNIDLTFGFVATDSDGDTAASSFTVSVDDDTPLVILPLNSSVDEDGIIPGAPALGLGNPGGPGDSLLSLTSATSILGISWGADNNNPTSGTGYSLGDRSVTFASTLLATLNGLQLTSGGAALKYEVSPSGTTLTAYTGATSADGQVFTVSLSDADLATYTFNLLDNLDHGVANTEDNIDLTFDFVATDSDGDTAAASFTVSVNDDSPVILPQIIGGFADEDGPLLNPGAGLPGSNPGPLSESLVNALATTSANGGLGIVWGADSHNVATDNAYVKGDRAATFATAVNTTEAANTTIATLQALNLKSGGVALTFSMNAAGTELVAHTGATPDQGRVFEVKLSDSGNGSYAFKLLGPLDHAEGAGENDLVLNFRFVATDSDGDTATSQFTVTVNDDSPTIPVNVFTGNRVDASFTDDEAVGLQTANTGNNSGFLGTDTSGQPGTATGGAGALFSIGADGLRSVELTAVTAERPTGLISTTPVSPLQAVFKDANGFSVLENVSFGPGVVGPAGTTTFTATGTSGGTAGTLVIRADGSYSFTQVAPFAHTGGNSGEEDLFINLAYRVTDKDGDTASNTLRVRVDDDAPTTQGNVTAGTTTDDDVQTEFTGNAGGSGDVADTNVAQGGAGALFSVGADGLRSIVISPMPSLSTVYKNTAGFAQTESATWGSASTSAGGKTTWIATSANNGEVARLEISADGSYTFTQSAPLVHAATSSTTEDNLPLAFNYTITDGDGDTATGRLTVNIDDDTPVASTVTAATVLDDEAQTVFAGNAGGSGDVDNASVASGAAGTLFTAGADGLKSVAIASPPSLSTIYKDANGFAVVEVANWANPPLTSAGGVTTWTASSTNNGTVATLVIGADGSYTFTQFKPLVHSTNSATEENRDLVFNYVVTDGDNDTASGSLTIRVNDDTPVAGWHGATAVTEDVDAGGAFANQTSTGTLNFSAGADGGKVSDIVYRFGDSIPDSDAPTFTAPAFKSGGVQVTTGPAVIDASAFGGQGSITVTGMAGAVTVYSLVINQVTGAYTYTLLAPIDHPDAGETGAADPLTMVFDFVVTDGDGDKTAAFNAGMLQIDIRDDAPASGQIVTATAVSEDALAGNATAFGYSSAPATATGVLIGVGGLAGGADGPSGVSLKATGQPALTAGGETVKYVVVGGTLYGYVDPSSSYTSGVPANAVLSLALAAGSYTFTLLAPIDHTTNDQQSTQVLPFSVDLTDGDGDTVSVTLNVSVEDGWDGNDLVTATGAAERLVGGPGNDTLNAGGGDDTLIGGAGDDRMSGDAGKDLFIHVVGSDGNDVVDGGAESDSVDVTGLGTDETFTLDEKDSTTAAGPDWTLDSDGASGVEIDATDVETVTINGGAATLDRLVFSGTTGAEEILVTGSSGSFGIETRDAASGGTKRFVATTTNIELVTARGEDGHDRINASAVNDGFSSVTLFGDGGNDTVTGGAGSDALYGGAGDDSLIGGLGADYIFGGLDNDFVIGGDGDDVIEGNDGNDTVFGDAWTADANPGGNDSILGGAGNDMIVAGAGNDTIDGGTDADNLQGERGNDSILGGAGNDTITGGDGNDTLRGGQDNDDITGGAGADSLFGDEGDDVLRLGPDIVVGSSQIRNLLLGDGTELGVDINGMAGTADIADGGGGSDQIVLDLGSSAAPGFVWDTRAAPAFANSIEAISGTGGNDLIMFNPTYTSGAANGGVGALLGGGNDSFGGTAGADEVYGGSGQDVISGLGGADSLYGVDGDDTLWGGAGNDFLDGGIGATAGSGNDTLIGGAGDDRMFGRDGNDQFVHAVGDGNDVVDGGSESGATNPDYDILRVVGDGSARTVTIGKVIVGDEIIPAEGADSADVLVSYTGAGAGSIRADEIERVVVQAGPGAITLAVGDVSGTAIAPATIVLEGAGGDDVLDLSGLGGNTRVQFIDSDPTTGGDTDKVILDGRWRDYTVTTSNGVYSFSRNGAVVLETSNVETFEFRGDNRIIDLTNVVNVQPDATNDTASVTEDTAPSAGGNILSANDTDANVLDVLRVTTVTFGSTTVTLPTNGDNVTISGAYGSLVINASGVYTYTLDSRAQALGAGAAQTETFSYVLSDLAGLTDSATLTVTVNGMNDAPTFGGQATGSVTEDGTLTIGGTLAVTDPDAGQSSFQPQTNAPGTYGTFSITTAGVWTYTLTNTAANVQALNAGQSPTEVFTVTSADGTNTSVTVTVNGANEPVVAVTANDASPFYAFTNNASSPNSISLNYADLFEGETAGTTYGFTWLKSANSGNAINWLTVGSSSASANAAAVDSNSSGMTIARISATTGGITVTNYVAFVLLANETGDPDTDALLIDVTNSTSASNANYVLGDNITLSAGSYGTVNAGGGDDLVRNLTSTGRSADGGTGNDAMYGNSGNDTYSGGDGFDYLSGLGGNDSLSGNDGDDVLLGGAGNDTLSGGNDEDTLIGGDGTDSLSGGDDDDLLEGGAGNDILAGNDGEDVLLGGAGDDLLIGGDNDDTLTGGAGADRFRFEEQGDRDDTILDFGSDDVIELEGSEFGMGSFTGLLSTQSSMTDANSTNNIFQVIASDGANAGSSARFIAFNQASGATSFYYDSDGGSSNNRILLATLENGFDLSAQHIRIV